MSVVGGHGAFGAGPIANYRVLASQILTAKYFNRCVRPPAGWNYHFRKPATFLYYSGVLDCDHGKLCTFWPPTTEFASRPVCAEPCVNVLFTQLRLP